MKYPPGVSLKNPGGALKYLLRFPAKMKNAKEKKDPQCVMMERVGKHGWT
jgi:hypothetical protein